MSVTNPAESETIMLKKTVAGAALLAAALAMPGAPALANTTRGAPALNAQVGSGAAPVAYYRYGHPGYRHYTRPYAYQGWGYRPYAYGGYYPGYYGGYSGWGYPTGYWGGYGWGPGVSFGVAPGLGIGFGF